MLSKEEIEKARSNLLRGNDIESACLIMEETIWGNLVQVGGRVNIVKVAMRQILNFIEEYKEKGYLDVVKEKVQLKEKNNQLEQENNKQSKMIDEMAIMLERLKICYLKKEDGGELLGKYRCYNKDDWKQYFEKKVEGK